MRTQKGGKNISNKEKDPVCLSKSGSPNFMGDTARKKKQTNKKKLLEMQFLSSLLPSCSQNQKWRRSLKTLDNLISFPFPYLPLSLPSYLFFVLRTFTLCHTASTQIQGFQANPVHPAETLTKTLVTPIYGSDILFFLDILFSSLSYIPPLSLFSAFTFFPVHH